MEKRCEGIGNILYFGFKADTKNLIWGNFFMMGVGSSAHIWRMVRDRELLV